MFPAVRALLSHLIDYAGIFPPAALPLATAVQNYVTYSQCPHAWALGRFVVPAARISEIPTGLHSTALIGLSLESDIDAAKQAGIDVIECKADSASQIDAIAKRVPTTLTCYYEIPFAQDPAPFLQSIASAGARAKIRTGGLTPQAVPSTAQIARFLEACAGLNVPFKATAGLHHPLRNSPANRHGFLNVFLAAAFLRDGIDRAECHRLLDDEDPAAFQFDSGAIHWRNHSLTTAQIQDARRLAGIAFGSCSFEEPLHDLEILKIL